jgi:drug/metabolite transporter (DMT)-like permease
MTRDPDDRSLATLVSDLVQQLSTLVQTEGKLLRSEVRESGRRISAGAIEILAGAGLLIAALVILLQALVQALAAAGLGEAWASLLVGVVVAIIGYLAVQRGTKNLTPDELALPRSTEQLRKDATLVKEQTQ